MVPPTTKPQPVLIVATILAMLTFVVGGLAALGVSSTIVGALGLALGALNIGAGMFVRARVVPLADTAAYNDVNGILIAGPAAEDIVNGQEVQVLTAVDPPVVVP